MTPLRTTGIRHDAGALIAIFIASKRRDYKDIGKLSIGPGIFNINEPVISDFRSCSIQSS
ncbi:hypothetical protein PO124_29205 [Bacillus licheniformis]|nr:hypothetical protein [Bacillus licheniformis]